MKTLVVGLGSIARRHIKNLKHISPTSKVVVWRQSSRVADLGDLHPLVDHVVFEAEDALTWQPKIALITNPASHHVETGIALAQAGCHLYIEKPLSNALEGVDELISICQTRALTLMVGYHLRFNHSLRVLWQALEEGRIGRTMSVRAEVGQYLPEWRPDRDYRLGVSARRELGGGVLLELSHELDYMRWLLGEARTIYAHIGSLGDLEVDVEDMVELILEYDNGIVGSIHLDMVQRSPTRGCRIIGTEGTLVWNGLRGHVQLFSPAEGSWTDLTTPDAVDHNEMYVAALRHFLECVEKNYSPLVDGEDGRQVLRLVAAAKQSAETCNAVFS